MLLHNSVGKYFYEFGCARLNFTITFLKGSFVIENRGFSWYET